MCELTGAKYTTGEAKKAQIAGDGETGFKRFFDFEKIKSKFIVTDIYDEELPVGGKARGNKNVYSTFVELILMNYLSEQNNDSEIFTRRKLWLLLGMTNDKYGKVSNESLKALDKSITDYEINHFYNRSNRKLERILLSALGNLRNRRLIDWELQTVICKDSSGKDEWFVADDEEKKIILDTEYTVLHEFGFQKIIQVFSTFKTEEYFNRVNEELYNNHKWKKFYKRFKIIYVAKNIRQSISEVEISLNKALLNTEVANFLNNEAERIYEDAMQKYDKHLSDVVNNKGDVIAALNSWKPPINYILAQNMLVDELIRTGHNDNKITLDQIINLATEDEELDALFPEQIE